MATIQLSGLPAGFKVQPHVQALANKVEAQFGLDHFLTYAGHGSETPRRPDLALDIFANKEVGDRLAAWLVENIGPLGIDYVIWWQRIYNPEVAKRWRDMADRGGTTANHKDHVHVSFEATAATPPMTPLPQQEDDMPGMTNVICEPGISTPVPVSTRGLMASQRVHVSFAVDYAEVAEIVIGKPGSWRLVLDNKPVPSGRVLGVFADDGDELVMVHHRAKTSHPKGTPMPIVACVEWGPK